MTRASVNILGCRIDALNLEQTLERCHDAILARDGWLQHVCVNAAKLVSMRDDDRLAQIVGDCGLVSPDGQSVVWAARLLGEPVPERVAGIDLMFEILSLSEREGFRVYVLGAREDVLEVAVDRLRQRYPGLVIAGHHHGYFSEQENAAVCASVRDARPDVLLVAITSPRKEYWLAEYGPRLGVPFAMGVGGAIDVVAGVATRAPRWMQRSGLEWAYRLVQEPRRLARRYAKTNAVFLWLVGRALIARRLADLPSWAHTA